MFSVSFEYDVVSECELEHGEDEDAKVELDTLIESILILGEISD